MKQLEANGGCYYGNLKQRNIYIEIEVTRLDFFFYLGLLTQGVLVVVHPHLKHMRLDASLGTKLLHDTLIVLQNPPAKLFCKGHHLLLLLLGEPSLETLLAGPAMRNGTTRWV